MEPVQGVRGVDQVLEMAAVQPEVSLVAIKEMDT
jgi:hypothetical protein